MQFHNIYILRFRNSQEIQLNCLKINSDLRIFHQKLPIYTLCVSQGTGMKRTY